MQFMRVHVQQIFTLCSNRAVLYSVQKCLQDELAQESMSFVQVDFWKFLGHVPPLL